MARSEGTVIRWDEAAGRGLIDVSDVAGDSPVDAAALDPRIGGSLRAGQVVDVEWTASEGGDQPVRIDRVTPRDDLQATPGA